MSLLLLFGGGGGGGTAPLARLHDDLGQVLIRRLGDAGGPRADRTAAEIDNIIDYVNDLADGTSVIPSAIYCIHHDVSAVGNVGAGLDTLHTFSVPSGTLATNGDYLHARYQGTFANTEDDKQTRVTLDGQVISTIAVVIDIEAGDWSYDIYIIRTSATTVRASVNAIYVNLRKADGALVASPSGGFVFTQNTTATVSNMDSNALALTVLGEGTNTDDVVQNLSIIELRQQ